MTSANEAATGTSRGFAGLIVPYVEIFRVPHAWRFSVAGIIGRMPMSMAGLGTVLLISAATGRYGVAGTVAAALSLGTAAGAPQVARLTDRYGQGRVLAPVAVAFAVSVLGLVAAVQLHAASWVFFLPGIAAGVAMPSLGPMARTRWSSLLAGSPRLHTAFSLESVADELCFIIGPAAVTVLATQVHPAAGLAVTVALCLAGTLWFASQRDTEPRLVPRADRKSSPQAPGRPSARSRLAAPTLTVLVPVSFFIGGMFVTIDLSTVAFATSFGHKAIAGFILGVYALGSATGGLWYGSRTWRAPVARRMGVTLTATVAGVCSFWAMPSLVLLTIVIYLCGMTIAPTLIAAFSLLEATALPGRATEAMSWLSTGISVGVAAGATAAGFILDAFGPRWGYAFAASCGGVAVAVYLTGLLTSGSLREAPAAT
jgi:predicted MFS family arabinose efflux permease